MIDRRAFTRTLGLGTGLAGASLVGLAAPSAAAPTRSTDDTAPGTGEKGTAEPVTPAGTHTSFGRTKQVRAGLLDVGHAEVGPAHGPVVICLHGWPYDIHSFVDVAPRLAAQGYRVIVPYLRGHGTTRLP